MPAVPRGRKPLEYKTPSRFNVVTVGLLVGLAMAVYVGVTLWPVWQLRSEVTTQMLDVLPHVWRANLRDRRPVNNEIARMKGDLVKKLRATGVKDPSLSVVIERGEKLVAIQARFTATATFRWLEKTVSFALAPRVETDAARVDW